MNPTGHFATVAVYCMYLL